MLEAEEVMALLRLHQLGWPSPWTGEVIRQNGSVLTHALVCRTDFPARHAFLLAQTMAFIQHFAERLEEAA